MENIRKVTSQLVQDPRVLGGKIILSSTLAEPEAVSPPPAPARKSFSSMQRGAFRLFAPINEDPAWKTMKGVS